MTKKNSKYSEKYLKDTLLKDTLLYSTLLYFYLYSIKIKKAPFPDWACLFNMMKMNVFITVDTHLMENNRMKLLMEDWNRKSLKTLQMSIP